MSAINDSTKKGTASSNTSLSSSSSSSSNSSGTPSTSDNGDDGNNPPSQIERKQQPNDNHRLVRSPSAPSSPTSLTIERRDSNSMADIPSEILIETQNDLQNRAETSRTTSVHGHKLPLGWTCKYDPSNDEYNFELDPEQFNLDGSQKQDGGGQRFFPTSGKSPTIDNDMQTSRRPTYHLFECKYGYHFPSSPTPSMISELARQVQKSGQPGGAGAASGPAAKAATAAAAAGPSKTRLLGYGKTQLAVPSDEEDQARRLRSMFPTAPEPIFEQMIRIYQGREGLIKAALISLGYKRQSEYGARQATAQSPILLMMSKPASKKLYDKLVGYFPEKDENLIKSLMYKHKEVEHEIISALVELGHRDRADPAREKSTTDSANASRSHHHHHHDRNGSIMKLRYLKVLYPTCEEIELYHLLHCNDLNAQRVMEIVEKRGHKRSNIDEVLKNRKSQTQQMRAQQAAQAAKDKAPSAARDFVETHRKRTVPTLPMSRVEYLKENLRKKFDENKFEDGIILAALQSTDFNENLAERFLRELDPMDETIFYQRYKIPVKEEPNVVAYPCKAIQKCDSNFMSIESNEFVCIPREVVDCDNALALLKVDASTYTEEDFPKVKFTHRIGTNPNLRSGPKFVHIIKERIEKIKQTTRVYVPKHQGSQYETFCADANRRKPSSIASGRNKSLARRSDTNLRSGHNPELLRRQHPFFIKQ